MFGNFKIFPGVPEIEDYYNELLLEKSKSKPDKTKLKILKKLEKTFALLGNNPKHSSLNTHDIAALTKRYGCKVFESYIENKTPSAGRIFWVYGPYEKSITIIGIEPHPNDKNKAYDRIKLSSMPD